MTVRRFTDDDSGYLTWRADHPNGLVINVDHYGNFEPRLHAVSCHTLQRPIDEGKALTWPFYKVCSDDLTELKANFGAAGVCSHCADRVTT